MRIYHQPCSHNDSKNYCENDNGNNNASNIEPIIAFIGAVCYTIHSHTDNTAKMSLTHMRQLALLVQVILLFLVNNWCLLRLDQSTALDNLRFKEQLTGIVVLYAGNIGAAPSPISSACSRRCTLVAGISDSAVVLTSGAHNLWLSVTHTRHIHSVVGLRQGLTIN